MWAGRSRLFIRLLLPSIQYIDLTTSLGSGSLFEDLPLDQGNEEPTKSLVARVAVVSARDTRRFLTYDIHAVLRLELMRRIRMMQKKKLATDLAGFFEMSNGYYACGVEMTCCSAYEIFF